jgi:hypothetical protein
MNLLKGLDKRTAMLCSGVYLLTTIIMTLIYFYASVPEDRNYNMQVVQAHSSTYTVLIETETSHLLTESDFVVLITEVIKSDFVEIPFAISCHDGFCNLAVEAMFKEKRQHLREIVLSAVNGKKGI